MAPTSKATVCMTTAWQSSPLPCSAPPSAMTQVLSNADVELYAATARMRLRPAD